MNWHQRPTHDRDPDSIRIPLSLGFDEDVAPGRWRLEGQTVFVHCPSCRERTLDVLEGLLNGRDENKSGAADDPGDASPSEAA